MSTIFISYNRHSGAIVKTLAEDIRALGHTVWFDRELSGGQAWWDQILAKIRECDALVFVLDPESMNSTACNYEYGYAADLGKTILPVLVAEGVSISLLPPTLSQIQFVDYRTQDRNAALHLARALTAIPPSKHLPDPLPTPPQVPLTYLGSLTERIASTTSMSYEEQSALVVDLKRSLRSSETADDAITLLKTLRKRRDLLATIAEEVDELLGSAKKAKSVSTRASEPELPPADHPSEAQNKTPPARRPGLRKRLATALSAAVFGAILVAIATFSFGTQGSKRNWLPISLLLGSTPWAIVGAITEKNKRVIAIALVVAAIGVIIASAIAASQHSSESLLIGVVFGGGGGALLGAIVGAILKKRKGW
jgi:hypothetical protein